MVVFVVCLCPHGYLLFAPLDPLSPLFISSLLCKANLHELNLKNPLASVF